MLSSSLLKESVVFVLSLGLSKVVCGSYNLIDIVLCERQRDCEQE
jgi:hypothetical protein